MNNINYITYTEFYNSQIKNNSLNYILDTGEIYFVDNNHKISLFKTEENNTKSTTDIKPLICSCCGAILNPLYLKCEYCGVYYK